ncbi:helicase associated domain-containing protein [Brevibacterium casei]|uniref:helicase associated domain-containing protein n=1 Tax=Brevibacterium casei TaxID=33889 RepID=UPI0011AB20A4|nr:helicase associated domain-containing protein [Brevibacterium casei]
MGRGRVDFDRGIARVASYAREHGHANPKAGEVWLDWQVGTWVANLRLKYRRGELSAEQIADAEQTGVRLVPPYRDPKPRPPTRAEKREALFHSRLDQLEEFHRTHHHINVRQLVGVEGWDTAGRWVARLRYSYRRGELPASVVARAESMGIVWQPGKGARVSAVAISGGVPRQSDEIARLRKFAKSTAPQTRADPVSRGDFLTGSHRK